MSALPFVLDARSDEPTHPYVVTEAEVSVSKGRDIQGRAVRTPKFKYHVWSQGEEREQLFDMINDPGETQNLASDPRFSAALTYHRERLAEWLATTDDSYDMN